MFTYEQAAAYLNSLNHLGSVPGLDNIRCLCDLADNPQDKIKTVHITGTNGKGSTGAYLAHILMQSGYTVGRFASPAVMCEREIFMINEQPASCEQFARAVDGAAVFAELAEQRGFRPTRFEVETLSAFLCFLNENCDIAIIEVGMGGRLDSTNVLQKPLLCAVTNVTLDHASFLGSTVEEIAREKAGIIKNGVPVVTGAVGGALDVIKEEAMRKNAPLIFPDSVRIIKSSFGGTDFVCGGRTLHTSMCGAYQCENAALAVKCAQSMGLDIPNGAIERGISSAVWRGRFEVLCQNPPFVIDGAHNPDGALRLAESVHLHFGGKKPCFVFGVFRDKDYKKISEITASLASHVYTVTPPTPRGLDARVLCECVRGFGTECTPCGSVGEAVRMARECADGAVCFGSLSFLAAVREEFYGKDGA